MNLTVIGSSSGLGLAVARAAAHRGHHVTGLERSAGPGDSPAHPVDIVRGDGRDATAVRRAVAGADAVITVMPGGTRDDPHRAQQSARVLITAMREAGVERLVTTSAYPIFARRPRLVMALLRRIFTVSYADAAEADRVVTASGLRWTVVRLNRLTDTSSVGRPTVGTGELDRPSSIARIDAAELLVDVGTSTDWERTAINVGGAN